MKKKKPNNNAISDREMDKSLLNIADIEAGVDVKIIDGSLKREAEINSGVTDNAPYKDMAKYKMVAYREDGENESNQNTENKKNLVNSQGS